MDRIAMVRAEGMVAEEKLDAIDHTIRHGMIGQSILEGTRDTLANGDAITHDKLTRWVNIGEVIKTEIAFDLGDALRWEGRR
jgi:hypothetical protein